MSHSQWFGPRNYPRHCKESSLINFRKAESEVVVVHRATHELILGRYIYIHTNKECEDLEKCNFQMPKLLKDHEAFRSPLIVDKWEGGNPRTRGPSISWSNLKLRPFFISQKKIHPILCPPHPNSKSATPHGHANQVPLFLNVVGLFYKPFLHLVVDKWEGRGPRNERSSISWSNFKLRSLFSTSQNFSSNFTPTTP